MNMDTGPRNVWPMPDVALFRKFEATLDAYMELGGFNDASLSKAAGLSADYIHKCRRRRSVPKMDYLRRLAEALGIEPESLMPGAPIPKPGDGPPRRRAEPEIDSALLERCLAHVLDEAGIGGPSRSAAIAAATVAAYQAFVRFRRQPAARRAS